MSGVGICCGAFSREIRAENDWQIRILQEEAASPWCAGGKTNEKHKEFILHQNAMNEPVQDHSDRQEPPTAQEVCKRHAQEVCDFTQGFPFPGQLPRQRTQSDVKREGRGRRQGNGRPARGHAGGIHEVRVDVAEALAVHLVPGRERERLVLQRHHGQVRAESPCDAIFLNPAHLHCR